MYISKLIDVKDVDVTNNDSFAHNELITYEALGLCEGEAQKFVQDGDNTFGGKFVTTPKGHPLGQLITQF